MSWTGVSRIIDSALSPLRERVGHQLEIDPAHPFLPLMPPQEMFRLLAENDSAADLACQQFASSRQWPVMETIVVFAVWRRLSAAREFLDFVMTGPPTEPTDDIDRLPKDWPEATMLKWVLVDYWHIAGFRRWLGEQSES